MSDLISAINNGIRELRLELCEFRSVESLPQNLLETRIKIMNRFTEEEIPDGEHYFLFIPEINELRQNSITAKAPGIIDSGDAIYLWYCHSTVLNGRQDGYFMIRSYISESERETFKSDVLSLIDYMLQCLKDYETMKILTPQVSQGKDLYLSLL